MWILNVDLGYNKNEFESQFAFIVYFINLHVDHNLYLQYRFIANII